MHWHGCPFLAVPRQCSYMGGGNECVLCLEGEKRMVCHNVKFFLFVFQ